MYTCIHLQTLLRYTQSGCCYNEALRTFFGNRLVQSTCVFTYAKQKQPTTVKGPNMVLNPSTNNFIK